MRFIVCILILFVFCSSFTLPMSRNELLQRQISWLDNSLVQRDSNMLKKWVHSSLQYGHSNGWIQDKNRFIADLYNGTITYSKIDEHVERIDRVGKTATVRTKAVITAILEEKEMTFKLKVLQVWVWNKHSWQLIARQSVKDND